MLDEGALQGMHFTRSSNAFYRRDRHALILHSKSEARVYALALDQHGARAARALVAALLGAGELKVISQQVQERCAVV
jgi:hypothetical protein